MGFARCFRALMRRNMIYRKRRWISSLFEFILPIAAFGILVGIKTSVENSESFKPKVVPASYPSDADTLIPFGFQDYVTALQADKTCLRGYGPTGFVISGIDPYNWAVPFVKCDSRQCEYEGQDALPFCEYSVFALAPSTEDDGVASERIDSFMQYLGETYPALLDSTNFPFQFKFVQKFQSSSAIDAYVTSGSYGNSERPKVTVAVVFDSEGSSNSTYNYVIRMNSTNFNNPENEARPASPTTPSTSRVFDSFAKTAPSACALQGGAPSVGYNGNTCTGQYMYNGAIPVQRVVNDWIINDTGATQSKDGSFVAENGVSFVYFPTPEYVEEGFYGLIANFVPLLVVLGLLYPIAACIRAIVQEKELRQKELMKMMSVGEAAIGWSWFISLYGFLLLSGLATAAVSSVLYSNSELVLLFIFWAFALLGSLMFAFVVAACFSRATRATLVGMLLFFAGYFLTLALDYKTRSPGLILLVSLHPVTSFSYGLQVIGDLEDKGVGLRSSTITFSDYPSGFAFNNVMASIILDCILWGLLSWYLNRVVRGDFGQPLPWYFVFTKSYWCPGRVQFHDAEGEWDDESKDALIPIEPVSDALRKQDNKVEIHKLTKSFGEKCAVDGLDLAMYSGQVTALLGHNGAGKTTTINMLTGMVGPTSGYAKIAGKDIRSQMSLIRDGVGICLQHDCLFPLLTVKEHLQFFSRIKGVYETKSYEEAEASVRTSIEDVALLEKRHTFSKDLSGGMKRKLSVAIAFCGDSKTIFLDEPTSGMDPFSRRFTWNVIRQYREDRCIILTTHFMDEADLLGDRIAIMAEGQLRCVGSSLFLKKQFGVGYQLTIEKQSDAAETGLTASEMKEGPVTATESGADAGIINIVKGAVNEAALLSNVGTELSFQLPIDASDRFPEMFEQLDEHVEKGGIVTYGVSITTLDEVFLMVARGETGKEDKMESLRSETSPGDAHASTLSSKSYRPEADMTETVVFSRHVQALFAKRAMNFKRDKKSWCCTTICPSLFALIGFLIVTLIPANRNMEPVTLSMSMNNPDVASDVRNPIPFNEAGGDFSCRPGRCVSNGDITVEATGEKYFYCGESAAFGFDGESCTEENYCGPICSITESDGFVDQITDDGAFPVPQSVSGISDTSENLADSSQLFAASQYGALYFTHDRVSTSDASDGATYAASAYAACIQNDGDYTDESQCARFGGIGYVVSSNFTSLHASILYQAVADEAIIRDATQATDEMVSINPTVHPLPITKAEEAYVSGEDAFTAWFLLVVSFPFVTGAFGTFIVAERQSKAKHLQTVSGVKPAAYWISSYLWDILNYQLPLWIVVILMYATGLEAFTTNDRGVASGTIITLMLYGPASAGFTYCVSFLFKSPSMCNLFVIVFGFLVGMVPAIVTFILRLIAMDPMSDLSHFKTIAVAIEWVCRFFPPFNMAKALFYLINIESIASVYAKPDLTVWSPDILLIEVIYLAIECFAYVALAITIDKLSNNGRAVNIWRSFVHFLTCQCFCPKRAYSPELQGSDQPLDEDVARETDRVLNGGADEDLIVVNDLTKVYENGKRAVDHMSLGIPPGQCFGLLGINGAGKTTTMAMLTAEFPPTSGDATLAGYSVTNEPEQTRRRIGYCPQFDAHFANMTGREHVELYASIKGVAKSGVKAAAALKLAEVGLDEYDSNRLSGGYSGGMKRKLSVACATIGEPQMVFLDEPSTGMDPVARRDLWKVISDMVVGSNQHDPQDKTSVILTTHSMEECEALCPRIGIMAGGKLRCLGSAQRLKSRYGEGFQVEAKVRAVMIEDADYQATLSTFMSHVRGFVAVDGFDVEGGDSKGEEIFVKLEQVLEAVQALTGDGYISSMIAPDSPIGYVIYKNASSDVGITLDELTAFCVEELRVKTLMDFFQETFVGATLRERQEDKVRYEVSSEGMKISSVFASIEENKEELQLSDYGVSQTSLEQIFNYFAAEAELAKQGADDR